MKKKVIFIPLLLIATQASTILGTNDSGPEHTRHQAIGAINNKYQNPSSDENGVILGEGQYYHSVRNPYLTDVLTFASVPLNDGRTLYPSGAMKIIDKYYPKAKIEVGLREGVFNNREKNYYNGYKPPKQHKNEDSYHGGPSSAI